jgi:Glycosyltransferase family 87
VLRRSLSKNLLALGFLILLTITLAYQITPSYDLSTRAIRTSGLHQLEGTPSNQYQWTNGNAKIGLNGIGRQHYKLTIDLNGMRPENIKHPAIRIYANKTLITSFIGDDSRRSYLLDIKPDSLGVPGNLEIRIESDTFNPLPDQRTLGAGLFSLKLQSNTKQQFVLPALNTFLWSLVISFFLWRVARITGSPIVAGLTFVIFLSALVYGLATERLWTVSLLPASALFSAIAAAAAEVKSRSTWLETVLALLVMLSAANFAYEFSIILHTSRFEDVAKIFEAAEKLKDKQDPYEYGITKSDPLFAHSYVYPPPFAQFIELFLPLGFEKGIKLWVILNFLLYIILIGVLTRIFDLKWRSYGFYAFVLIALNFRPAISTLSNGQMDILMLALLVATFALAIRERYFSSGATLACAIIVKLQPILMMPWYITRQRLRGIFGLIFGIVLIVCISITMNSPALYERYITNILPSRSAELTGHPEDQSLSAFVCRLNGVTGMNKLTPTQHRGILIAANIIAALFGVITIGAMWYSDDEDDELQLSLSFAAFIALMLLILPTAWIHYETQLLFPIAVLLCYAILPGNMKLLVIWVICAFVISFGDRELFADPKFNTWPLNLVQSYKFYGILLLWGSLIFAQLERKRLQ